MVKVYCQKSYNFFEVRFIFQRKVNGIPVDHLQFIGLSMI